MIEIMTERGLPLAHNYFEEGSTVFTNNKSENA
jgi:hypothetical protein